MIHALHLWTAGAYLVVGALFFVCCIRPKFGVKLITSDAELIYGMVGIFVYACALDHGADALHVPKAALLVTALFEAVVSVFTACFLAWKAFRTWRD